MQIRKATDADALDLAQVFFAAVREGPSPYTEAQRAAWLPHPPERDAFAVRLASKHVFLCEEIDGVIGFMTLEETGYIDLAYIRAGYRNRGVFRALFAAVEETARVHAMPRIWVHASLMAQPAFRAMGFLVMHHETVERSGQQLARALMEKHLT